jgi:hypothetical protein
MARRAEDDPGAAGDAAGRMRGQIVAAQVGFGLYDDAGGGSVDEDFAKQIAGDVDGGTPVEAALKDGAERHGGAGGLAGPYIVQ